MPKLIVFTLCILNTETYFIFLLVVHSLWGIQKPMGATHSTKGQTYCCGWEIFKIAKPLSPNRGCIQHTPENSLHTSLKNTLFTATEVFLAMLWTYPPNFNQALSLFSLLPGCDLLPAGPPITTLH